MKCIAVIVLSALAVCAHARYSPYAYSDVPVAYASYPYEAPGIVQYSSVDLAGYPYGRHNAVAGPGSVAHHSYPSYADHGYNKVVAQHVVAAPASVAHHSYPSYADYGYGHNKVVAHHVSGHNVVGLTQVVGHHDAHAVHHNVVVNNAVGYNVVGHHHNVHAAPHAVAVVPHHGATYTAVTKGAVHKAPLPGHVLSQKSINVAPAPGTL